MPKASKTSASETVEVEGYEGHLENFEGGYTVAFEKYTADADLSEFFKGLPDDQCQAPHWGYVLAGKVTFKTSSGEETFETGDAYYVPAGSHPGALRRHRGRRVQPDRAVAADPRRGHEEHGSRRLTFAGGTHLLERHRSESSATAPDRSLVHVVG